MTTTLEAPAEAAVSEKATALLEAVKALPLTDQSAFAKLFQDWKTAETQLHTEATATESEAVEATPPQRPDLAGRLKKLFPDGPIAGSSEEFWEEERADRF